MMEMEMKMRWLTDLCRWGAGILVVGLLSALPGCSPVPDAGSEAISEKAVVPAETGGSTDAGDGAGAEEEMKESGGDEVSSAKGAGSKSFSLPRYEETQDGFLLALPDGLAEQVESASCAVVGWDEDGYHPVLWGRSVEIDEDHVAHIPKDQSVMTLYLEDIDQFMPLTRVEESRAGDGSLKWHTQSFSFNSDGAGGAAYSTYHVAVDFEEALEDIGSAEGAGDIEAAGSVEGAGDIEAAGTVEDAGTAEAARTAKGPFLRYTLIPTTDTADQPMMEEVAYTYWKNVHVWKSTDKEICDPDGRTLPVTEWPGTGFYMYYLSCPDAPYRMRFQMRPVRELPGTYHCQLILELKDGSLVASELMPLQSGGQEEDLYAHLMELDRTARGESHTVDTEKGAMYFLVYDEQAVLTRYIGEDETLQIPEEVDEKPVRAIGCRAFEGALTLQEVRFPTGLTQIREMAFYGTRLAKIDLPEGLEYIGTEAFGNWDPAIPWGEGTVSEIETIKIGKKVIWIGDGAFTGYCVRAFSVAPQNPYYMEEDGVIYTKDQSCLLACPTGKNGKNGRFQVPDGVESIHPKAFRYNGWYSELVPDSYGIVSIRSSDSVRRFACDDLPVHLEALDIGKGLEEWTGIQICDRLSELSISEENKHYQLEGRVVYNGDRTELLYYPLPGAGPVVELPEGLLAIGKDVFRLGGLDQINEVHIPEGVTRIESGNFSWIVQDDRWDIIDVYLPDSLAEIEGGSFLRSPGVIIHASAGSFAASFAKENQIQLELTEGPR